MEATATKFKTVDEYISLQPKNVKPLLQQIRKTIKEAAPDAEELISYNMPGYKLKGMLVYFAAWKEHIGFYGASSTLVEKFKKELSGYELSKGTIKLPLNQPLPLALVAKIVKFRAKENLEKSAAKSLKK
ncbi:MAG: iron chaperone [Flavisolibacter sp.]